MVQLFRYEKAAARFGDRVAALKAGVCHEDGLGTAADSAAAQRWYSLAVAAEGGATAQAAVPAALTRKEVEIAIATAHYDRAAAGFSFLDAEHAPIVLERRVPRAPAMAALPEPPAPPTAAVTGAGSGAGAAQLKAQVEAMVALFRSKDGGGGGGGGAERHAPSHHKRRLRVRGARAFRAVGLVRVKSIGACAMQRARARACMHALVCV